MLCVAAPASADVTVDPPSAPQGGGLDLTFHVTNDNAKAAMTRVRLVLPTDTPVAEVYPLSVDDWAPRMTIRKLDTPLDGIHGGVPVTETTAEIIWTAMPGRGIPPGGSTDLAVSMGPLPTSALMTFTVRPTYADGSSVPALPPVGLELTPATSGGVTSGGGIGHDATGHDPGATQGTDVAAPPADDGPGPVSVAGWIVALLLAVFGSVALLRARRTAAKAAAVTAEAAALTAEAAAPTAPRTGEPVSTGPAAGRSTTARVTAWSYRDGP